MKHQNLKHIALNVACYCVFVSAAQRDLRSMHKCFREFSSVCRYCMCLLGASSFIFHPLENVFSNWAECCPVYTHMATRRNHMLSKRHKVKVYIYGCMCNISACCYTGTILLEHHVSFVFVYTASDLLGFWMIDFVEKTCFKLISFFKKIHIPYQSEESSNRKVSYSCRIVTVEFCCGRK